MSNPNPSKSGFSFAAIINLVLALTQIGILVVLALMLKDVHLIFKELEKIISGDNYIYTFSRLEDYPYQGSRTNPWVEQVFGESIDRTPSVVRCAAPHFCNGFRSFTFVSPERKRKVSFGGKRRYICIQVTSFVM